MWAAKLPHEEKAFQVSHKIHRFRVDTATCAVDDLPPHLLTAFYLKVTNLTTGTHRQRVITRDNQELLQKINLINRTKGKTDTHLRPYVRDDKFDTIMMPKMRKLAKYNVELNNALMKTGAVYDYWKIYKDWKIKEAVIFHSSRFPEVLTKKQLIDLGRCWSIERIPSTPNIRPKTPKKRPKVFMEFKTGKGFYLGRMEFVLYADVVPLTVANFMALCSGNNPEKLCYKGFPIFRITPRLYCQGGDLTRRYGPGGRSIYGETFEDENFALEHAGPGVLSMANLGLPDANNSQFMITLRPLHTLDGKNVVFGKLVTGFQTLYNLENLGTPTGNPIREVIIDDCGIMKRKKRRKL